MRVDLLGYPLAFFVLLQSPDTQAAPPDPPQTRPCVNANGADIRVSAAAQRDFEDICVGAADAAAFLTAQGIPPRAPVVIEVASSLPASAGSTAAGCWVADTKRAHVLTYAKFRKNQTWFGVPVDRALYRGLAAHEAAHAVVACNFSGPKPSIQATEYVAYVTMFSTMPQSLRDRILRAMPGRGFESEDKIHTIAYLFDPMRFGVQAYRHYLKPGVGPDFLRSVVAGKALVE